MIYRGRQGFRGAILISVYILKREKKSVFFFLLYVDDMLIINQYKYEWKSSKKDWTKS